MRMVSMKDIARECGVSVATVSKALNDYSDIGEATRARVHETAKRMGYFPNSSARALKTNRTYNLGVLFVDDAHSGLTHDFFAQILESFKVTAQEKGYDLTFTSTSVSNRHITYLEHCRYRGLDGIIIACINFYDPAVQELIQSDLPVVTIDHMFDNRIAIVSDNVGGMKELVEYAISLGHTRIAYIHGAYSSVTRGRTNSFYHTMAQHGLDVPEEYVREAAYRDAKATERETEILLGLPKPPTCILYPDDISSLGGFNVIRHHNLRIPEDISIGGYDGLFLSRILDPPLTTIWQDTEQIGRLAAEKLISLIEKPKSTIIEHTLVKGRLQPGGTMGKAPTF